MMDTARRYRLGELDGMFVDEKSRQEILKLTGIRVPPNTSWMETIERLIVELHDARTLGERLKQGERNDD